MFINTCPTVSCLLHFGYNWYTLLLTYHLLFSFTTFGFQCLNHARGTPSTQPALKMIISKQCGSRFQMDTIEMPSYLGYCYILRVVDHLSTYGFVRKLKHRNGEEMGDELVHILSSSMIPDVLQLDNGREVSDFLIVSVYLWNLILHFWYITIVLKMHLIWFSLPFSEYCKMFSSVPWSHVVKGRPRHPQSQGCIERSHATFKTALRAWMKENDNTPNWHLGMHVVQCQVNNHPIKVRGNLTPYSMYYSQANVTTYSQLLGDCHRSAKTEFGLRLAKMLVLTVKKMDDSRIPTQQFLGQVIQRGDKLFENLATAEEEDFTHDIIKEEARAIIRKTKDDEDDVSIQSEKVDAEEEEDNPDEDGPLFGEVVEEEEDNPDEDGPLIGEVVEEEGHNIDEGGPPNGANEENKLDEGVSITGGEQEVNNNDDKPADEVVAMEHATDDSDDDVFTSAKTSTDKSSSLNAKVATVESE